MSDNGASAWENAGHKIGLGQKTTGWSPAPFQKEDGSSRDAAPAVPQKDRHGGSSESS